MSTATRNLGSPENPENLGYPDNPEKPKNPAVKRLACSLPIDPEMLRNLRAGDLLSLSGTMLTARDAAHRRMIETLRAEQPLPIDLRGETIYYTGPCPAPTGKVIGSCGPTTSGRMDLYTPMLLEIGLAVMIGKGTRNDAVKAAMRRFGAIYLGATGGAGALLASTVTACSVVAYPDLGTEAVRLLTVRDFPAIVLYDAIGGDLYVSALPQGAH